MRIGIVGGGLLGAGAALELALRGHDIELFEREGATLSQASRQNEGKVHLGFVYGHDPSLDTARLMARGAYAFAPLLQRWMGRDALPLVLSSPFHYLVHRDSLRPSNDLAAFYARVVEVLWDERRRPGAAYLSEDAPPACRRLSAREREALTGADIADAYETSELAVDPRPLASLLRARLASDPRIDVHLHSAVDRITIGADDVIVEVTGPDGARTVRFDHVVNASWDDLLRIDRSAGIEPRGPWSFRFKRYVRVKGGDWPAPPSATIVLGGFGDVVRYDGGDLFLSWYPVGCTGLSRSIRHPDTQGTIAPEHAASLRGAIHAALSALVPALGELPDDAVRSAEVEGGVILALGTTDVHDPGSGLHVRSAVGPRSFGRYHSVDTGKWTTAPLFAYEVARRIAGDA